MTFQSTTVAARAALLASFFGVAACSGGLEEPLGRELAAVDSPETSVCWNQVRQTISGFGASSAWTAPDISDELADELFSPNRIGLSLLRLRITPNGTTSETATALKAQARGAAVWAAPWSPPGLWKTNGMDNYGGSLLPERYPAWAERLARFARTLEDQGVRLTALSAQNEPDYTAEWETCRWEPAELATFVGEYLVPALSAENVSPRLLAPESANWNSVAGYGNTLLRHPVAGAAIDIVATHAYGNREPYAYTSPAAQGKELWMTEWSDPNGGGPDAGMTSGLVVAQAIHDHLTVAEVNAWHYWWLIERSDTEPGKGGLLSNDVITRRAYVTGQYSRFVRPGSKRLVLTASVPQRAISVSAFLGATGDDLVLVVINSGDRPITQAFDFEGAEVSDLVPFVTNDELALEEQAPIPGGARVSYEFSPRSVTTLVAPVTVAGSAESVNPDCSRVVGYEESTATGCSCRIGAASSPNSGLVLLSLAGGFVALRRRAGRRALA